jgi:hypothetical protein
MIVQLGIMLFGLTGLLMALGNNPRARKWAPIVGLVSEVFWTAHAWETRSWGIGGLVAAYTAVYAYGAWVQWRKP